MTPHLVIVQAVLFWQSILLHLRMRPSTCMLDIASPLSRSGSGWCVHGAKGSEKQWTHRPALWKRPLSSAALMRILELELFALD